MSALAQPACINKLGDQRRFDSEGGAVAMIVDWNPRLAVSQQDLHSGIEDCRSQSKLLCQELTCNASRLEPCNCLVQTLDCLRKKAPC